MGEKRGGDSTLCNVLPSLFIVSVIYHVDSSSEIKKKVNKNNEGPKLYSMQKLLTLIPTNNCSETCGCSLFLVTYTNTNSFIANQFAIMSSINQHKMSYNDFNDYKYQQNKINNNKQ